MYSRYPNYRFGGIKIPENYSGNAFSEPRERASEGRDERTPDPPVEMERASDERVAESAEAVSVSASPSENRQRLPFGFKFDLGGLFRRGFGFEELLLLAVILLVSQNDSGDELILLLALLLFVG